MTAKRKTPALPPHAWEFKARFRRHAFGWRSQPAITRIKQAVAEIKKVAKKDPLLAADGAVAFLERVSPALENIDSSSGAIGSAVNRAIEELVGVIAAAPADAATREAWLERLFEAHERDKMPYIERLADYWGELCVTRQIASRWADELLGCTRAVLGPHRAPGEFFHGTTACLSALYRAERFAEILELLQAEDFWPYKEWAVRALAAQGKKAEALRHAESSRDGSGYGRAVDALCEEILLSSGMADEAYRRYGVRAPLGGTYLAAFRAVAAKYPHKDPAEILADLAKSTPGEEGKWFATAKDARLYDEALALARTTPCDPKTLARAARDHFEKQPEFAIGSGVLALHWIALGYGFEVVTAHVLMAYEGALAAAARLGCVDEVLGAIRNIVASERPPSEFLRASLGTKIGP